MFQSLNDDSRLKMKFNVESDKARVKVWVAGTQKPFAELAFFIAQPCGSHDGRLEYRFDVNRYENVPAAGVGDYFNGSTRDTMNIIKKFLSHLRPWLL